MFQPGISSSPCDCPNGSNGGRAQTLAALDRHPRSMPTSDPDPCSPPASDLSPQSPPHS